MSELVEKVAGIIRGGLRDDGTSADKARAAIAAVAEWLDAYHKAEYLQKENHASPALRAAAEGEK